jgi:hypothetical protein
MTGKTADPAGVQAFGEMMMRGETPEPKGASGFFPMDLDTAFTLRSNGELVVSVDYDGAVTLGEGIAVDQAAKEFWAEVAGRSLNQSARIAELEAQNEALKSERAGIISTKREQIGRLEKRQYALAYAIAGGEDAPGLLDSISTAHLCEMVRMERAEQTAWNDATATISRDEALREAADMGFAHAGLQTRAPVRRAILALIPSNPTPEPTAAMFGMGTDNDDL